MKPILVEDRCQDRIHDTSNITIMEFKIESPKLRQILSMSVGDLDKKRVDDPKHMHPHDKICWTKSPQLIQYINLKCIQFGPYTKSMP